MKHILLVEDEKPFARFVELELQHEGYSVSCAYDGETGLQMAMAGPWDLILLDVMLPGIDGIDLCRMIRMHSGPPIIMITARDAVSDRIVGLDSGADDYIPKPFAIAELLARIRALLRRLNSEEPEHSELSYREITMDIETMTVLVGTRKIILTKREFDILKLFLEHPGEVVTRDRLLNEIWGFEATVGINIVDVYIRYLRSKLYPGREQGRIQTVRGEGYMLQ